VKKTVISDDAIPIDIRENIKKINGITTMIHGLNYLKPSLLKIADYYYNFSDGETKVPYGNVAIIDEKIDMGYANDLYVYQKHGATNDTFIVYCYNGAKGYIGYVSASLAQMGAAFRFTLKPGTKYIRIYCSSDTLKGEELCISPISLDDFIPYYEYAIIKEDAIKPLDNVLNGKTIVNFGDSIFGNRRPPLDISTYISEMTGATVYNCAFGGCRMSAHARNEFDAFSMYRLAYAIANSDFSIQDAVNIPSISDMPSYFIETRALLKSIDFSKVDIITIAYGTNDFDSNVQLEGSENNTFEGALKYSVETLLNAFPNLQVYLLGQTYRFWYSNESVVYDSDSHENVNGDKLLDFVAKTKETANMMHVPFIDNYNIGVNQYNRLHYYNSNDGVHQNEKGAKLIAEHIAKSLY
jgi:lysophospholipase L1-like esterase